MALARSSAAPRVLAALAAVATLVAVIVLGQHAPSTSGPEVMPQLPTQTVSPLWVGPDSFSGLVDEADAVVDGRVSGVEPGEPIRQPAREGVPAGTIPDIPTQRVRFKVEDVIAGSAAGTVTLYQTGGVSGGRDGERRVVADGDPEFRVGGRYLLFLQRRPGDDTYLYFGPSGRFDVDPGGRLRAVEPRGAAAELDGASAAEAAARIRDERRNGR